MNYANFGRYLKRMNGMMLSQEELSEFINNLSEDSAISAGKSLGKTSPQMLMAAINGGITTGRVVELIHNLSFCAISCVRFRGKACNGNTHVTFMVAVACGHCNNGEPLLCWKPSEPQPPTYHVSGGLICAHQKPASITSNEQ